MHRADNLFQDIHSIFVVTEVMMKLHHIAKYMQEGLLMGVFRGCFKSIKKYGHDCLSVLCYIIGEPKTIG